MIKPEEKSLIAFLNKQKILTSNHTDFAFMKLRNWITDHDKRMKEKWIDEIEKEKNKFSIGSIQHDIHYDN